MLTGALIYYVHFRPIMKHERLKVELRGLEYMNDDPAEVDVLYAQVNDPTDR